MVGTMIRMCLEAAEMNARANVQWGGYQYASGAPDYHVALFVKFTHHGVDEALGLEIGPNSRRFSGKE